MVNFDFHEEAPHLDAILTKVYSGNLKLTKIVDGAHDVNWTKEHELFYSEQPKSQPFVKRLFFKDGKKSYGFVHLRPVSDCSKVTETYLIPPKEMNNHNTHFIKCLSKYSEYGENVECVPFIMPETILGMCAHGSIWICLKILENKSTGKTKARNIPFIQTLATGRPFADHDGLFFVQIARLLRMCNCNSFYTVNKEHKLSDEQMLFAIYSYVESGIPVIIGVDVKDLNWWGRTESSYHSIVVIGHTMNEHGINGFIIHDESTYPYQVLTNDDLLKALHITNDNKKKDRTREFVVAVPPEVGLSFEIVFKEFADGFLPALDALNLIDWNKYNIESVRPMLVSSKELFQLVLDYQHNDVYKGKTIDIDLILSIMRIIESRPYLWVIFFYQSMMKRSEQTDVGFYIRDATLESDLQLIYLKDEKKILYYLKGKLTSIEKDEKGLAKTKPIRI
jgi:hypothetical protein